MSQTWITPDGSQSGGVEVNYNTPWLFEDPLSTEDASAKTFKPSAASSRGFVDPRVAPVGALNSFLGAQSSGNNTRLPETAPTEWAGGLGLPSWAVDGLTTAGKFGMGMMGVPSIISSPVSAGLGALLGDANSTAAQVQNKIGNALINAAVSALVPGGGLVMGALNHFGFDPMRGLTNLNAADPLDGGTKAGFWNDAKPGPSYYNPSSPYGSWMDNRYSNPSAYSYGNWTGPNPYNPFSSYGSWTDPSYYNQPSSYGSWMDSSYYNPSSSYGSSSNSGSSSSSGWNGNSYSDSHSFTGGGSGGSYSDSGSQSDSDSGG